MAQYVKQCPISTFPNVDSIHDDFAQIGAALSLTVSKTVQLIVTAANDGPVITGPNEIEAKEDKLTSVGAVIIEDPDCDETPRGVLEVVVNASNGTVQFVGSVAGLYLMEAVPGTLKIRGKTASVNTALAGLSYMGNAEFSGEDDIVVTADDLGNSGTGGRLQAKISIHVTVVPVNDPPNILVPPELNLPAGGVLFVFEDQPTSLGFFGISDPDDVFLRVLVSARVGTMNTNDVGLRTLQLTMRSGEAQPGVRSSITFEGPSKEVSAALARLTYTSSPNWNSIANGRDMIEVSC